MNSFLMEDGEIVQMCKAWQAYLGLYLQPKQILL